jgi:hypothetical protein
MGRWVALLLAAYFYLVPLFEPTRMLLPFLLFLFLGLMLPAVTMPGTILGALVLSAILFLMLGIKELFFIDREKVYASIAVLLFLLFAGLLYSQVNAWDTNSVSTFIAVQTENSWGNSYGFLWLLGLAVVYTGLIRGVVSYGKSDIEHSVRGRYIGPLVFGLAGLILWEVGIALLFLPLPAIDQLLLFFMTGVLLLELIPGYFSNSLSPRKLLVLFSGFFSFVVVVLTSATWTIY